MNYWRGARGGGGGGKEGVGGVCFLCVCVGGGGEGVLKLA